MTSTKMQSDLMSPPADEDVVLSVRNVSKKFCRDLKKSLFYGIQDIASEMMGLRGSKNATLRKKEFWALNDVSFDLRRGEALGLVGKNGSGKSTLLRVIAGLIKPDIGTVEVKGRVAPLIALSAGFNPVLTGRENIYANMSILGLNKAEIDERFDEVVEFAEIGEAIDSPVQSYSSGMQARLGFASAIHTDPEILLIDEVLAVGDSRFRAKCYRRLDALRQKGTTFILVSHNANSILTVCDSAVYLKYGELITSGDSASVMKQYEESLFADKTSNRVNTDGFMALPPKDESESFGLDLLEIFFRDANEEKIKKPISGESVKLCIKCKVRKDLENVGLSFIVKGLSEGGEATLYLNSFRDNQVFKLSPGNHEIQVSMPSFGLKSGRYIMDIYVREGELCRLDAVQSFNFSVVSEQIMDRCIYYQSREWNVLEC